MTHDQELQRFRAPKRVVLGQIEICDESKQRFEERYWVNPKTGCWEWQLSLIKAGYGDFCFKMVKESAHRFGYRLYKGSIPKGMHIDHLCRVRSCVNAEHLEVVTPRVNSLRGESPMAKSARKTHCKNGHPFDEKNTFHQTGKDKKKWRNCRICRNTYRLSYSKAHYPYKTHYDDRPICGTPAEASYTLDYSKVNCGNCRKILGLSPAENLNG